MLQLTNRDRIDMGNTNNFDPRDFTEDQLRRLREDEQRFGGFSGRLASRMLIQNDFPSEKVIFPPSQQSQSQQQRAAGEDDDDTAVDSAAAAAQQLHHTEIRRAAMRARQAKHSLILHPDDPPARSSSSSNVSAAHPRAVSRLKNVDGSLMQEPVWLPASGTRDSANARQRRREEAARVVGRLSAGNRILVEAQRVVNNRIVEGEFPAILKDPTDFAFVFEDDPTGLLSLAPNKDDEVEQQQRVKILQFRPILTGNFGLPPVARQLVNANLLTPRSTPDAAIFVGVSFSKACMEVTAAVVVRSPVRSFETDTNTFWKCELDACMPPRYWHGDEHVFGRVYGGGSRKALGFIALTAAFRAARWRINEIRANMPQGSDPIIAVILEDNDKVFSEAAAGLSFVRQPRPPPSSSSHSVANANNGNNNSEAKMQMLANRALADVINNCYVATTNHSFVAQNAADVKRRSCPTVGEALTQREADFFETYVAPVRENLRRRNLPETAPPNGRPRPTQIDELGASIATPLDFAKITRRCKARTYVPMNALEPWAQAVFAQLQHIVNSEESKRRDDAMLGLLLLPHACLPVKGSNEKIEHRLRSGNYFNLAAEPRNAAQQQQQVPSTSNADAALSSSSSNGNNSKNAAIEQERLQQEADDKIIADWLSADKDDMNFQQLATGSIAYTEALERRNRRAATTTTTTTTTEERQRGETRAAEDRQVAGAMLELSQTDEQYGKLLNDASLSGSLSHKQHTKRHHALSVLAERVADCVDRRAAIDGATAAADAQLRRKRDLQRLGEAVERFASDFQIRPARKLIETIVEGFERDATDMPFDEKVQKLNGKHVPCASSLDERQACVDDVPETSAFSAETVEATLRRMPRQAASCLESWSPRHLLPAVKVIPEIAELLGIVCSLINDGKFGKRVMDIIRLGRLVGIPKPDGGIRPITLTCFFAKLTGGLVWQRVFNGAAPTLEGQYAIGRPEGCGQVVHYARFERQNGMAILRFDIKNAFTSSSRARIARALEDEGPGSGLIRRFFNMLYGETSDLIVFGPDSRVDIVKSEEGVRQGDAFSSYLFALLMHLIRGDIVKDMPYAKVRMYADDITITVPPQHARWAMHRAILVIRRHGLEPCLEKCSILCDDGRDIGAYPWTTHERDAQQREEAYQTIISKIEPFLDHYVRRIPEEFRGANLRKMPEEMKAEIRVLENDQANRYLIRDVAEIVRYTSEIDPFDVECRDAIAATSTVQICCAKTASFSVLGANVSDHFDEYNAEQERRHAVRFYDTMRKAELHPQLSFTLARFSGFSKIRYYASMTPPEHSGNVVASFQRETVKFLEDVTNCDLAGSPVVHNVHGLGVPDYNSHRATLYEESRNAGVLGVKAQEVSLVNKKLPDGGLAAHSSAQVNAPWLMYQPRGYSTRLTPGEFRAAIAIRCGLLPRDMSIGHAKCSCGVDMKTALDVVSHSGNCKTSGYTPAQRHNRLKFDVANALRRHSFAVTVEPTCYAYADRIKHRPDLIVWTSPAITTDFVIVQQDGARPGVAAAAAASGKNDAHKQTVAKAGHVFVPFALEAHGYTHGSVRTFVDAVTSQRRRFESRAIHEDLNMILSVSLARSRIAALLALMKTGLRDNIFVDAIVDCDDLAA